MTTDKKVARRKLSMLELAAELGNVSKACKIMGYSRQRFYEIRRDAVYPVSTDVASRVDGLSEDRHCHHKYY